MGCYYFMFSPVILLDSLHLYYRNEYMYKILPFFCYIKERIKKNKTKSK